MHLVHTGLDGDTTDGRLGDVVHATISTVNNAAGSVLGKLQQLGLLEEIGGGAGPGQSAGIRDGELARGSDSCGRTLRFTLPKRSDGRPLVGATAVVEHTFSDCKPTASITVESEREPDHGAKRKYTRKEKTNSIEGKAAYSGKSESSKTFKREISVGKGKNLTTDSECAGAEPSADDEKSSAWDQ